ncbi:hypothetical protein [Salinisphaera aquimarina]|uniref:Uncharacterized protein n=1 Tax=Salinisphaera aquimarina TaxID=2094031 RepID=A0ABV7EMZ9_9GAMM
MCRTRRRILVSVLIAAAFTLPGAAIAADNSGIVILDQQHRSTPFGQYDSQRRTEVFGPSSGYRYEEYSYPAPGVIVSPRHGYGRGNGRVIEQYGPGAYGPYGATSVPAAPRINGYANPYRADGRGHRDDRRRGFHGGHDRGRRRAQPDRIDRFGRDPSARAIEPAQRAMQPAERAIR